PTPILRDRLANRTSVCSDRDQARIGEVESEEMSDAQTIRTLMRERLPELAQLLFPHGHREGMHWCVGSSSGEAGRSLKICLTGEKAGLWGDFAEPGRHSRNLLHLWMAVRKVDFKTALRQVAEWLGCPLSPSRSAVRCAPKNTTFPTLLEA